jgi:CheY-like chemotaxis protein
LSKILQSVERANQLTNQLLAFSRKIESELEPVDLNQAVERMVELLKNTLPKMIDIQLRLGFDLRLIHADPAQLEQIIMNLCINAGDAMPEGGKLLLATENVILDEAYCKRHLGAVPGQYTCLNVVDTGCGMDAQTLLRIFEPFYTTKEVGRGTGLGLAMVYGIVKNHNGYITCDSVPGEGTTFHVYFPVIHRDSDTRVVESPAQEETPGGNETLLLVDDEELIIEVFSEVFTQFGYNVMTAENGEEALAILRERNAECALVILDLDMPVMGGEKCFVKIREICPSAKIIISSGHPVKGDMRRIVEEEADGFISKPYLAKNILKKVREVLDARV